MQLELLNDQGQAASKVDAPETVFGREYNEALIHQIVVAYQANARQGTRAQKDREQVHHSTKKPFKQKGTGRARAGMTSSPLWRGGGRIFPNSPDENFTQKINKKMYRAGMASIRIKLFSLLNPASAAICLMGRLLRWSCATATSRRTASLSCCKDAPSSLSWRCRVRADKLSQCARSSALRQCSGCWARAWRTFSTSRRSRR